MHYFLSAVGQSYFFAGFDLSLSLFMIFRLGRGLKVDDILKDDEVLTAFLLREAGLSESIVYQLVNAQIRLEQVHLFRKIFAEVNDEFLRRIKIKTMLYLDCGNCTCLKRHYIHYSNLLNMNTNILMLFCSLHLESQTCS